MTRKYVLTGKDFHYLFQNATDAIWVHDMDGIILLANKAAANLSGYSLEELIGSPVNKMITESTLKIAREVKRSLLSGEYVERPYSQKLIRKDGKKRDIVVTSTAIIQSDDIVGFMNIARDVTAEKYAMEALAEIVDVSPLPTFVINREHRVTHWNRALAALTGIDAQDMVGKNEPWISFYTEKRPTMADLIVDRASAEEINSYYPGKCKKSNLIIGAYEAEDLFPAVGARPEMILNFNASPIKNSDGDIIGAIETLRDVTEARALQEKEKTLQQQLVQADKMSAIGHLAASLAHEINNPLAGVLVYSRLMKEKIETDSLEKDVAITYMEKIMAAIEYCSNITRSLLDFSRQREATVKCLEIEDVIDQVLFLVDHKAELGKVKIERGPRHQELKVVGDAGQLQQVFMNISVNAIEAMAGGGVLSVWTDIIEREDKYWASIKFTDTGHGIEPENLKNLFVPFFSTKQDVKGVGLGLSVSQGIIHAFGGNIEVYSTPEQGSTFIVYLPVCPQ